VKNGWKRGSRVLAVSAVALLVAGGAVAVAQAAHGGKGKAKAAVAKKLVRDGVHADVSLIRADGSTDAFAVDRGKVTASSSTSITLQRADGKSVTLGVTSTTVARRMPTVGKPALAFSRNGVAFRILAAGPVTVAPVMPALAGKSPVVHLDVSFVRADGSTGSITLDRGQVTASSSTSLTIKRDDGKSVTFTVGAGAIVRGHLVVGGKALVLSRNGAVVRVFARG
jgi:hypothetical protein